MIPFHHRIVDVLWQFSHFDEINLEILQLFELNQIPNNKIQQKNCKMWFCWSSSCIIQIYFMEGDKILKLNEKRESESERRTIILKHIWNQILFPLYWVWSNLVNDYNFFYLFRESLGLPITIIGVFGINPKPWSAHKWFMGVLIQIWRVQNLLDDGKGFPKPKHHYDLQGSSIDDYCL